MSPPPSTWRCRPVAWTRPSLPIDRGRRLFLRLFRDESDQPIVAKATVLRVEPVPDEDQYLLGMQFQPLPQEAAHRLRTYIQSRSTPSH